VKEAKPKFFIYENNKSMHVNIRESIDRTFGFEAICINSALVSAQNRERLYWVGMRNQDGTYSKIPVEQPEDRGVLVRDILHHVAGVEPINTTADGKKARTLMAGYYKYGTATLITNPGFTGGTTAVAEPINVTTDGKARTIRATCYKDGIRNMVGNDVDKRTCVAEPVPFVIGKLADAVSKFGYIPERWNPYNNAEITDKSPTLTTCSNSQTSSSSVIIFDNLAEPIEWDENGNPTKAISYADGKAYVVYKVEDGQITIKGKQYPIKLADGFYIIRKLTVNECKRLQTVPEWYDFSVISDSQAYKCLGNGWTCDVITHLIRATQAAARRKWLDDLLGGCL
jgi:DNA (cytosine-5)-methyltransferase 3A